MGAGVEVEAPVEAEARGIAMCPADRGEEGTSFLKVEQQFGPDRKRAAACTRAAIR
jgi:hypothetical protein